MQAEAAIAAWFVAGVACFVIELMIRARRK